METLRLKVRDALQEMLYKQYPMLNHLSGDDIVELTCDISDKVFEALGISEEQQDIEGGKIKIIEGGNKKE